MRTFIIAAISADGYIAKDEKHPAFWTSKADKTRFVRLTKEAGIIVMGSNTYTTLPRPLKERVNIVYSRTKKFEGVEMTQKEPRELLKELEYRGFKTVAICGGSHIYNMFMKAGVVDTIYLTIEPIIFGKGIRLFDQEMLYHLNLKSVQESTESGSLLIEYTVDYSGTPKMTN
ncbi:MAG TPA: dihydrofolate reductase family protein [Candidatus Paceibacterota bacterium]